MYLIYLEEEIVLSLKDLNPALMLVHASLCPFSDDLFV